MQRASLQWVSGGRAPSVSRGRTPGHGIRNEASLKLKACWHLKRMGQICLLFSKAKHQNAVLILQTNDVSFRTRLGLQCDVSYRLSLTTGQHVTHGMHRVRKCMEMYDWQRSSGWGPGHQCFRGESRSPCPCDGAMVVKQKSGSVIVEM